MMMKIFMTKRKVVIMKILLKKKKIMIMMTANCTLNFLYQTHQVLWQP